MAQILLIDDHADVLDVVAQLLKAHGHDVDCCTDAANAMARLRKRRPDAIIADQRLPGKSGVELIREIRALPNFAQVRLILCSADSTVADTARASGADAFWLKGSDQLLDDVEQLAANLPRDPDATG